MVWERIGIAYDARVLNPMTPNVILWTELGVLSTDREPGARVRNSKWDFFFMPNEHKWSILFLSMVGIAVADTTATHTYSAVGRGPNHTNGAKRR